MDDLRTGLDSWFVGLSAYLFYPAEMRHDLGAEKRSAVATTIDSFSRRSQRSEPYLIQICVLFPSLAPVNGFVLTGCPSCGIG